ncbi:hypothetical protein BD413DRAFT_638027 [Trametes elegans]|nr:hypothetical protein BD413DRAFT_638027 [Trametes elegans]
MVARYSKKRSKYTYAERVLGALSDIQKDHRKHAVHMATLRAHVRKMADARKDKMGPQWTQWVSRTVNKLADDGILDTSDPHGNVTFTPNAKKTITKVRRESMGPGVMPSPGVEHKIWKDVTRRFSGVGVKRPRRRSSAQHSPLNDEDGENGSPPRKRQARKSTSRMTKAELEEALRDAQELLDDAQELQPANAEELAVLQEELAEREKQVAALREELARLKERQPTDDHCDTVGTSTRLLTPPPTNPWLPSSAGRTTSSARSRLPAQCVTRTLSGSLISNISKRPTPEPSDVSSHGSVAEEAMFDDVEDVSMSALPEIDEVFSRPQHAHGLATPKSSPLLMDENELCPDVDQDETFEARAEGEETMDEVAMFRNDLASRTEELDRLRDEHQRLMKERDELHSSVLTRDDRVQALEAIVRDRDEELSASKSRSAELEQTLTAEVTQKDDAEAALKASEAALAAEQQRNSHLTKKLSKLEEDYQDSKASNDFLEECIQGLSSSLRSAKLNTSDWRAAHLGSEGKLKKANVELANTKEQVHALQDELETLKQSLARLEALVVERTTELDQTKSTLSGTQEELTRARDELEAGRASQATMATRITELERDLEHAREEAHDLNCAKDALERASGNLEETVGGLREELSHAKTALEASGAQVQQSQDVIRALRASHAEASSAASAAAADAAALQASVAVLEAGAEALREQLQSAKMVNAEVRESVETERAARRLAESEAVATKASRDKMLTDLADKTARLSSATEELARARRAEDGLRGELNALKAMHAAEVAARLSEKSALEGVLETTRAELKKLEVQREQTNGRLAKLAAEFSAVVAEKERLAGDLQEALERSVVLQADLDLAQDDIREGELEIEELRKAKAEDEASIQSLKAGFAKLRQLQMDALNEVDDKVRQMTDRFVDGL